MLYISAAAKKELDFFSSLLYAVFVFAFKSLADMIRILKGGDSKWQK